MPGSRAACRHGALAKRQKLNAVKISDQILAKLDELKRPRFLGHRRDGHAERRQDRERRGERLVFHLVVSIIVVIILLFFTLGWREAAIVALAIPLTLFITLGIGMVAGQTINRITLFALILSLGLLVDDAIVVVENIHRHYKLQQHSRLQGAILAVNEIGMPTILATLTVVLAFIPMAFVTGMMGPYMLPIPFNVPVAMITSLFVAFIVTPWASYRLMKAEDHEENRRPSKKQGSTGSIIRCSGRCSQNRKAQGVPRGNRPGFSRHHELSRPPVGQVPHASQGEQEHLPRFHRHARRHGDREHGQGRKRRGRLHAQYPRS